MFMNKLRKWILFFLVIQLALACKKKDTNPTISAFNSFDRTGMLTNIGNNIIVPSYTSFASKADSLYIVAQQFVATPNSTTLSNFQNQWLQVNLEWKSCEVYNFGPALTNNNAVNIQSNFVVTSSSVESVITSTPTAYDSTFVPKQATGIRGISVIEYLLFDPTNGNTAILNNYTANGTASQQRLNYLKGLVQDIKSNAHGLLNAWLPSGGNYIQTFISANGNDINSSISFLVNQIVYLNDYMKNYKIGRPMGIRINASNGSPLPTYVETYYSSHAFDCMTANFKSIDNLFFGVGNNGIKESGFSDLITAVNGQTSTGQPLASVMRQRLDSLYFQINAFNIPLEQAVVNSGSTNQLNTLYTSSKQLLVLTKLDMVNSLGVILTTTDNDGD
jgi:predicted lipoprotein